MDRLRSEEKWAWLLILAFTAASLGAIWWSFATTTLAERDRALATQSERVQRAATTFAAHVEQVFVDSGLALRVLAEQIASDRDLDPVHASEFASMAEVVRRYAQADLDLRLVQDDGTLRLLSSPGVTYNVGDRDYFRVQRPYPGVGLYVDQPLRDRVRPRWVLDLSLAVTPNAGRVSVLSVALGFEAFDKLAQPLVTDETEVVSLYRDDGTLLYRYPLPVGFPVAERSAVAPPFSSDAGYVEGPISTAYRRVERSPLWVVVQRPAAAALDRWSTRLVSQATGLGVLTIFLLGAAVVVSWLLWRLRVLSLVQENLARTDALTGLLNRRAFWERCELELTRAKRHPGPLALLVCDLDHFKRVNDRFGHPTGDIVLQRFARLLTETLRTSDANARIGGEEFAILLPATPPPEALEIAERLRRAVEGLELPSGTMSTSVGLASWDGTEDLDTWMGRADKALYSAKEHGRNRVAVAPAAG